jgi:hypothetical protein
MKTVTYWLRLDKRTMQRIEVEARRRQKSVAAVFREVIGFGLAALPRTPEVHEGYVIADTWEKLGPAPKINYDKL